jgi:hypothetical protein
MFKVKLRNGKLKILYYFAVFSLFLGVFMGLFSILVNDNNIRSANFLKYYFNEFIGLGIFSLYTIYHIYFITTDEKYSFKLKKFLFSVLVGLIISSFFSIITGKRGHYGNQDIILMPLSFFYVNFVCIFLFYKDYNNKKIVLLLSLSSFMIQFIFSNALNGKSWLGVFYIILSLIIIQIRKKRIIILSIFLFFVILFSVLVKTYFENDNSNNLSMIKLEQALSFISVTDADWYDLLPNSPKITIEEILNIGLEYINKPFYFLTGKGYGGSIVDYRGTFGFYDEFAFSMDQYNNNIFIEMHSSFATIFLEYGLWGILLYIYICILGVKKNNENPWSIIGIIWFLFFVGYSFSLALFGIPALVLGLSNNKIHNTKY